MMSRSVARWVSAVLVVGLAIPATSCLRRQYPVKKQYVVDVSRPGAAMVPEGKAILSIARVRTEPQYDRKSFVYRTGEYRYADDFYNTFYVPPSTLIRVTMFDWISASGVFAYVIAPESLVQREYTLESRLQSFYIDRRPEVEPGAVVAFTVTLVNSSSARGKVLFEKSYEEREPITGKNESAYVTAWAAALARALAKVELDLAAAVR
ncbi:MAG: hypothetical protein E4H00_07930 [Myxococcales bacterium]|nr:MAG: hypothetical protein E4H00_07930 [Myxococcales bacterium]